MVQDIGGGSAQVNETARATRVLVAEDETIIRLDLCALLEDGGLEVCAEVRNGAEAVALARETRPDVAIFDVRMPELDGIEAARQVIAERPMPIVMLTAHADEAIVRRAVDAGVFAYLVKPFRGQDVVPAVRTALARHAESKRPRTPARVDVVLPSATRAWPLTFGRSADGRLDVSFRGDPK
jgi:response regulator NasT